MPRKKRTILNSNKNHNEIHIHIGKKRNKNGVKRNGKFSNQQPIFVPQYLPQYIQSLPPLPPQFNSIINPPENVLTKIQEETPKPISLADKRLFDDKKLYEEYENKRFSKSSSPIKSDKDIKAERDLDMDLHGIPTEEEFNLIRKNILSRNPSKDLSLIKRLIDNRDGRSRLTNKEFNIIDSVYPNEFSKNSRIGSLIQMYPELKTPPKPRVKKIYYPPET